MFDSVRQTVSCTVGDHYCHTFSPLFAASDSDRETFEQIYQVHHTPEWPLRHSKLALLSFTWQGTDHQLPSCNCSNCCDYSRLNCVHSQSNKFNCLPTFSVSFSFSPTIAQINCANWFSSVYPLLSFWLTLNCCIFYSTFLDQLELKLAFPSSVCLVQLSVFMCLSFLFTCRINNSTAHFACRLDCILKHPLSTLW